MTTQRQALVAADSAKYDPLPPHEAEFLRAYRNADEEGKRYVRKALKAAAVGLLPEPEDGVQMSPSEMRAFLDALPELWA